MKKLWLPLAFIASPFILLAHPGHGEHDGGYTITHYFTEPVHFIPIAVVMSIAIVSFYIKERKTNRK